MKMEIGGDETEVDRTARLLTTRKRAGVENKHSYISYPK